jgi:cystathionine gamma-lyase
MTSPHPSGYATPGAFRRALTDRLRCVAAPNGPWPLAQLQRQFAYDRLLTRLYAFDETWIVKGAAALLARHIAVRHTIDLDIYRAAGLRQAEEDLRVASAIDASDWFVFEIGRGNPVADAVMGLRLPVVARLGVAPWANFHVDLVSDGIMMTGAPDDVPPLVGVHLSGVPQPLGTWVCARIPARHREHRPDARRGAPPGPAVHRSVARRHRYRAMAPAAAGLADLTPTLVGGTSFQPAQRVGEDRVMTEPGDGTRCVHAGLPVPVPGEPFLPGPVFAAPYHLDPVAGPRPGIPGYGRAENPTRAALESAIGELEGGECVVYASGMAAIAAVFQVAPRGGVAGRDGRDGRGGQGGRGGPVVMPSDGYYSARELATTALLDVRFAPTAGPYPELSGASLVLLESPANPGLDMCDIPALSAAAHAGGALVAVDNTTPTPLGQRPLDLGADISVASATKALTGHSDLLLGYACTRSPDLAEQLRRWRNLAGAIPGPFEAWLAHRSLATLDLRLARQSANAAAVAELLAGHPAVGAVRWPGRPADPAYDLAKRQLRRVPGVVTFTLAGKAAVDRFLTASRLVLAATSFGGLHTTADRRAQWGDAAPPGLVRLSCGVEDTADLLADLDRALAAVILDEEGAESTP